MKTALQMTQDPVQFADAGHGLCQITGNGILLIHTRFLLIRCSTGWPDAWWTGLSF